MIPGVEFKDIKIRIDERGFFTELLRSDWNKILHEDEIVQFNLSYSYPGVIRAWHKHLKGQADYFICIKGAVKVCIYDDDKKSQTKGELHEYILSEKKIRILRVPGKYWHGYKAIGTEPIMLLYGVNKLYDYSKPDEERRPWNDQTIVPNLINGKKIDPRIGKPWDWNYPPHK